MMVPLAPFLTVPTEIGVRNHLWAATSPDVVSGKYYVPVGVLDEKTVLAKDETLSRRLWEWTENEFKSAGFA